MRNWPAVLLLGLTLLPGPAQAQTYRWVDEAGTVHYSQGMDSIPERYRAQARPSVIAPTPSRPDLTEKPPPPSPARRLLSQIRTGRCRSEEHTSELQSRQYLVCRLLLEKKKTT